MSRLYFATDIHGSEICFKKFLKAGEFYEADTVILGGDMTGKALVPIVHQKNSTYKATLLEQEFILETEAEIAVMEQRIKSRGYYPFRTTPDEIEMYAADPEKLDIFFHRTMLSVVSSWMEMADQRLAGKGIRCFVCPGNDDSQDIDSIIASSKMVECAEGRSIELGNGFTLFSTGWTNPTPWKTFREEGEERLASRLEAMIGGDRIDPAHTVFSFHCPPYGSGLDDAPELDENLNVKEAGQVLVPVGSRAVRDCILKHQPILSLHGHIHEAKGISRLGKTLAVNPGSTYEQGLLQGVIVELDKKKGIRGYTMTSG
jgi:Icc-related predicted phosphoesterase